MFNWKPFALGLVFLCLGEHAARSIEKAAPMQWKRAKTVDSSIVKRFCRSDGPIRFGIIVLKDRAGEIGGYEISSSIMDDPVNYYDSQGTHLTMFHIFGGEAERTAATRIIKALKAEFPVSEPLRCSGK